MDKLVLTTKKYKAGYIVKEAYYLHLVESVKAAGVSSLPKPDREVRR